MVMTFGWNCPVCGQRVVRHILDRNNWLCRECTEAVYGYTTRRLRRDRAMVRDIIAYTTYTLDNKYGRR